MKTSKCWESEICNLNNCKFFNPLSFQKCLKIRCLETIALEINSLEDSEAIGEIVLKLWNQSKLNSRVMKISLIFRTILTCLRLQKDIISRIDFLLIECLCSIIYFKQFFLWFRLPQSFIRVFSNSWYRILDVWSLYIWSNSIQSSSIQDYLQEIDTEGKE
jgi:hypothetical protein